MSLHSFFTLLIQVLVHSRVSIREDLLDQIVALDAKRIMSRLRSRYAARTRKTAGKPPLADSLLRSISDPSIRIGIKAVVNLKRIQSQSGSFSETFARFEASYDGHEAPNIPLAILADLLRQAFEFDTRSLRIALNTSSTIDPSLKVYLPEAISKLGRYYSIANDLIDAARNTRYTIFRQILIERLEKPAIGTGSVADGLLGFEAVFERNISLLHQQRDWQRHSRPLEIARTRFQSRISNCATTWKIHAEIQLLFFYEENPDIPQPRMISSSKSACYLCDLFIKSHGKFLTPRTHGKLYDKWLLPEWTLDQRDPSPRLLAAIERFNASLKARISRSLHDRQRAYPQPNESSLQLRELWSSTSTLAQDVLPLLDAGESDSNPYEMLNESTEPRGNALICTTHDAVAKGASGSIIYAEKPRDTILDGESPMHEGKVPGDTSNLAIRSLSRGHSVGYELNNPAITLIVRTEAIDLHISCGLDPSMSSFDHHRAHCSRWVEVEWLAPGNRLTNGSEDVESFDVDLLNSRSDKIIDGIPASDPRPIILHRGEHIVTLRQYHDIAPRSVE